MSLQKFTLFLSIFLFVFYGCKEKSSHRIQPEALKGEKVFEELKEFLTISPREAGTMQSAKAAKYILAKLISYGIESEIDYFEDETPCGVLGFRNVVGKLEGGTEKIIIIASHYDTKGGIAPDFQGANDSGSSTAVVLELARIFSNHYKMLHTQKKGIWQRMPKVLFAFFDGEECKVQYGAKDGLHGSCRLVEVLSKEHKLNKIIAFILLDMVGDKDLKIEIPPNTSGKLMKQTFEAAHKVNARKYFTIGKEPILDDHTPFLHAGVPSIVLIDFHYGSAPEKNDYWHTKDDTIDKISAGSLEIAGRVTIELFNKLVSEEIASLTK